MVPIAENAVPMTPKIVSRMDWKTAKIELKTAMIAPKMEEMRFPIESIKEGMFGFVVDSFWFGCVVCVVLGGSDIEIISALAMTFLLSWSDLKDVTFKHDFFGNHKFMISRQNWQAWGCGANFIFLSHCQAHNNNYDSWTVAHDLTFIHLQSSSNHLLLKGRSSVFCPIIEVDAFPL